MQDMHNSAVFRAISDVTIYAKMYQEQKETSDRVKNKFIILTEELTDICSVHKIQYRTRCH